MRNRHRIFMYLVRFLVVISVASILSCSDDHDSTPPPTTQPPPIWSTYVEGMVNWGPDAFDIKAVRVAGERVYVAGSTSSSGGADVYAWVAAFSSFTGSLAPEFGDGGKLVITDLAGAYGGLEVAGSSFFLLGIFNPKLQERDAVDGSWIRSTECWGGYSAAMAFGADSAFLLFGIGTYDLAFHLERRLLADGSLVETFGTGGEVTTDRNDVGMLTLYENRIFILRGGSGPFPWEIEKRNAETGELDASFGIGGVVVSQAGEVGQPVGFATDATGIYVLVRTERLVLSKRSLSDGALVHTFGDQGMIGTVVDEVSPTGLALDNGTLFVAGEHRLTDSDSEWTIEAFDSLTGERISGFGLNGVISRNVSDGYDSPVAIAADVTGVYVASRPSYPNRMILSSQFLVEKYSRGE